MCFHVSLPGPADEGSVLRVLPTGLLIDFQGFLGLVGRVGVGGWEKVSFSSLSLEKQGWGLSLGRTERHLTHLLDAHVCVAQEQAGVGTRQVFAELAARGTQSSQKVHSEGQGGGLFPGLGREAGRECRPRTD